MTTICFVLVIKVFNVLRNSDDDLRGLFSVLFPASGACRQGEPGE